MSDDTTIVEHIDVPHKFPSSILTEMGIWLDEHMPNPPINVNEPRRWMLGVSHGGQFGIRFFNEWDATMFCLRWGGNDGRKD